MAELNRDWQKEEKKKQKTTQLDTEIVCVIDRSGSMRSVRQDAIGGFNTFLEEQKKIGDALFTYVQFDDEYEVVHNGIPLANMKPLDENTFVPRGMTALLDAIGKTINTVESRKGDRQVIVAILTDGQENASKEFKRNEIFENIRRLEKENKWTFVFLAANQDAIKAGGSLGIQSQHTYGYAGTGAGTRGAYSLMSCSVKRLRGQ